MKTGLVLGLPVFSLGSGYYGYQWVDEICVPLLKGSNGFDVVPILDTF